MKYFNKLKSTKIHFTRSLRYISIILIFSTMELYGVIGGNTYEDVFTGEIYNVSPQAQQRFIQAKGEDESQVDKQLAALAHNAASDYQEGSRDYLAVSTLYYHKFQCVYRRLTRFLVKDRDFLQNVTGTLKEIHGAKRGMSKASEILKTVSTWLQSTITSPQLVVAHAAHAVLQLIGTLSSNRANETLDLKKDLLEIDKAISKINREINQIEEGVVNEPIKVLEETYIKQKALGENFINEDLQYTIEENLINSRKATYPFPWIKKCLENALKLPKTRKMLTFSRLEDFKRDEFFQRYSLETREGFEDVANNLVCSSDAPNTSKVPLRSSWYIHGDPGIGKTEAIMHLTKFFDLPVVKLNITSAEDLKAPNLIGMEALMPGATAGWLGRPLLATNAEGKTYLNAVLILDEFDRILLDPNSGVTGLAFFLDFLAPTKKSFYSPYFAAEMDIRYMHIFVTGNSEIPNTRKYKALRERFSKIIKFEPMGTDQQKEVLLEYLPDLGEFYKISNEVLDNQKNYLTEMAMQLAENPSSIRSCKQELSNIVLDFSTGGRAKVHARTQKQEKKKLAKPTRVVKKTEPTEQLESLRKALSCLLSADPILDETEEDEENQYVALTVEEIESADAVQSSIRETATEMGIPLKMEKN